MRAKSAALTVALALTSPILASHATAATTYNAWSNFSIKANPTGPWSYLAGGTLLAQTIPNCNGDKRLLCWWNGQSAPTSATVIANKTGQTVTYYTIVLPVKYLSLDPENSADATVQWTAPAAGKITIAGNFLGVDTNEATHNVAVTHNGAPLKTWAITTYKQEVKFHFNVTVAAGDTIAFKNITNNNYSYLSTGLHAIIQTQ
jgi:hypothetical protein